jgi:amino-acid N-acetyltransferase
MELEFADPGDEVQIKRLLAECELPGEDITPAHLQHFLVMRDGPHLAGVIGLEEFGPVALLRSLAVPARWRGRGIASQLAQKAEEHAWSRGVEAVYLLTTTAEGFFARRGYDKVDRDAVPGAIKETVEFQSLCPASAVCMVRHLGAG